MNAQILGVSTDSVESHTEFSEKNGIAFPLISDTEKSIKKLYGRGRVTYLIDKSGVIRYVHKGVPDNEAFLDRLKALENM